MTYEIKAADGHVYLYHSEVGDGPARVCLDDTTQEPPVRSIEEPGDDE